MATGSHMLANGSLLTRLGEAGGGSVWYGDRAVTRDGGGYFIYLRDLDDGAFWSVTYEPTGGTPEAYAVEFGPDRAVYEQLRQGLVTALEVAQAIGIPLDVRRLKIRNTSGRPRRIEVTSYAEVVLHDPAADAGHPAFSKLFIQTERPDGGPCLLARRRPRGSDDERLWLLHGLLHAGAAPVEAETDRMRFLGRGGTTSRPRALTTPGPLSGTTGNVLDPIVSLRCGLDLAAGEAAWVAFTLGVAHDHDEAQVLARRFGAAAVEALFADAEPVEPVLFVMPTPATRYRPATFDPDPDADPFAGEALWMDNGYGGFSTAGDAYLIRVRPGAERGLPPLPWTNVVANEQIGFLMTERGAGTTWSVNSRENRLTPWSNDPVCDPHGEAVYVRDEEEGVFWSPLPGPTPGGPAYGVRHGFGFTRFHHTSHALEQEVEAFVPPRDPVKIVRVRLTNTSDRTRRLSVFTYHQWVLGVFPNEAAAPDGTSTIRSARAPGGGLLVTRPDRVDYADRVAFTALLAPPEARMSVTADREAFLGRYGLLDAPRALTADDTLDNALHSEDPCAAFQATFAVPGGASVTLAFVLGEAASEADALDLLAAYRTPASWQQALDGARRFWHDLVDTVRIETPAPELDVMVNGWLLYQNLSCRIWGRTAFYQSGGAYGFRDQLQDASALAYARPALFRRQLLLHAAHQFEEGDVLHWWHPPSSRGIRTRFSDDLLWLPYLTLHYLAVTGDAAILDERVPFVTARGLEPDEEEVFLQADVSGASATLYEHCCRALDRGLTRGRHGFPLMGTGDWNDGMNRVGRKGEGESLFVAFFLYDMLAGFARLCEARGDRERLDRYAAYRRALWTALNGPDGWDGAWYRRAYYDDGAVLGSASNDECRIDALAQAWAVLSRAAPEERARQALESVVTHLVDEEAGIIRLLTPAFDRTPHDPGYIKGYLPGVRENGGQYTHAALWAVRAFAEAGRLDDAARLLRMLSPARQAATPAAADRYRTEPYVIAADVYGVPPHVGRGGWTWYTGSAGWMYRIALESVLGFGIEQGATLRLTPQLPSDWPGFTLRYRHPETNTTWHVEVRRGDGPTQIRLDEQSLALEDGVLRVPIGDDGAAHHLRIDLAPDHRPPAYRPA